MFHEITKLGPLTIEDGNQVSDSMDFTGWRSAAKALTIYGPGELDGTAKVQVSTDDSSWLDLQSAGADITVPADGAVTITNMGYPYLRVASSSAESPAREFEVVAESGV